jgi:hypothetical protein
MYWSHEEVFNLNLNHKGIYSPQMLLREVGMNSNVLNQLKLRGKAGGGQFPRVNRRCEPTEGEREANRAIRELEVLAATFKVGDPVKIDGGGFGKVVAILTKGRITVRLNTGAKKDYSVKVLTNMRRGA